MDHSAATVTFLFTDIEGSTRLWEEHAEEMRAALRQHDDLLRASIESCGGRVFKTVGDAFCAAFPSPRPAIEAVLAAQQWLPALAMQTPEGTRPIKVRMALHTGVVEERDGDYFGQPLNRVARLLAIAHGGQTLLSDVAHDLCRDSLPSGCTLKHLGEHRLKDLGRPESVYQICHPGLPADFPPLRSLDNPELPNNLPQQVTSFIGREKEVEQVKTLLGRSRLVTLTGSGGCGKTRLALQAAADMLDGSGDGVWLVELAALTDPDLVPQTAASVLGVKEEPGKSFTGSLLAHLKPKQLLLVLDNCEHLLDACAKLADAILRQCPRVIVLATSREGLGIAGELMYRVPSLSQPDPKRDTTPESLSQFEAVRLFIERAQFHQPQFNVSSANAPALASVCHRLDGIPLAIELAAARVRSLSVEEVNQKLDQRFRLLTGGSRTALPRQQTLRSLIDWSYDLLNEAERALLCRLSVFSGGWTLDAAEQVCAGEPVEESEVLDLLTSLTDKSLVAVEERKGRSRYRLLETVRQYARDRLLESGKGENWRDKHLTWYVRLGEKADSQLGGPDHGEALNTLETEHDNIRAAIEWCVSEPNHESEGLSLARSLWTFWYFRCHLTEGRQRIAQILDCYSGAGTHAEASAVNGAGVLAYHQGDTCVAKDHYERSLALWRSLGHRKGVAAVLHNLANLTMDEEEYAEARKLYEEAAETFRELGETWNYAVAVCNLGIAIFRLGDRAGAVSHIEESLAVRRSLEDKWGISYSLMSLGKVAVEAHDWKTARSLYRECLEIMRDFGDYIGVVAVVREIAGLAASSSAIRAAQLWGAAERMGEEFSVRAQPYDRKISALMISAAREGCCDESGFDAAWREGRAMTQEQAINLALEQLET